MSRFERVLLYIGAPKTGTTTIQNILRRNRARLFEQGFHVARAGQSGAGQHIDLPAIVLSGESRADLDRHFDVTRRSKDTRRSDFHRDLDEELAASPRCHTLLLFSEHMFYSDAGEIPAYRSLLSPYARTLDCLMYLRRQDRWLGSLAAQIRKTDPSRELQFDQRLAADFGPRVQAWYTECDTCLIRRFEAPFLHQGDLLADFAHAVGLETAGLEMGDSRANPSLRQEQLELMDALNARLAPLPADRRVHLRQGFVPLCTRVAGGARIEFAREAARTVFTAHKEVNAWLALREDPAGPPLFFDGDFEEYPEVARNQMRYSEAALHSILEEIRRLAASQGAALAPRAKTTAARPVLVNAITTAFTALRRSALGGPRQPRPSG